MHPVEIRKIKDTEYIVHKVSGQDSLCRLSLYYNVPEFTLRQANGLAGDNLYCKIELLIPVNEKTRMVG
jgi:hypothetical protein